MLDLHQRVHPKHTVVGWFSTGLDVSGRDALIHAFYSRGRSSGCGVKTPMHLVVDTDLKENDRVSIKAHIGRKLMLGGNEVAAEFVEVPTTVLTAGPEGLALAALRDEKGDGIPGDSENLRKSFATLQGLISEAHAYVTDVLEGRRDPDVTIGRCAFCAALSCEALPRSRVQCCSGCASDEGAVTCARDAGICRISSARCHARTRPSSKSSSRAALKTFCSSCTCRTSCGRTSRWPKSWAPLRWLSHEIPASAWTATV